jgi:two-component system KDP operon response regulator KdpE
VLAERLGFLGVDAIPCARDWKLAVRSLTTHQVALILLDVDAQPETGDFFRILRDLTEVPIVARGSAANREQVIWYLDNGASDYVGRTVTPDVLSAKVQSLLRTVRPIEKTQQGFIRLGAVAIDLDNYSVAKSGVPVSLTPIEFRLLRVLAENVGRACSHDQLLERVWGEDFKDCAHYLRLYMGYLRNKLEDNPRRPKMLLTEWGYGYRLVEAQGERAPERARRAVRVAVSG